MITTTNQLDEGKLHDLEQLMSACKKVDGSTPNVYMHLLTQARALPTIVLYYEKKQLIGFLSIYFFFENAIEVALFVHPKARHKGIALQLMQSILPLMRQYNYPKLIFSSPAYLNDSWLLTHGFTHQHSEYYMERHSVTPLLMPQKPLDFRVATGEDIPQLCLLDEQCFHKTQEELRPRFEHILSEHQYEIILAYTNNQFIGKAHLRWQNKGVTLSDIAVFPEQQGLGLGTALITYCINYALSEGKPKLNLDVETHNKKALELYTRLGFHIENACDFWVIDLVQIEKSFRT